MNDKAILKDKKVVEVSDILEWGKWLETANRVVKQETLPNGLRVSTVFLGVDYSFGAGPKLWFETMVFPKDDFGDLYVDRYTTWEEAENGHKYIVKKWKGKKK